MSKPSHSLWSWRPLRCQALRRASSPVTVPATAASGVYESRSSTLGSIHVAVLEVQACRAPHAVRSCRSIARLQGQNYFTTRLRLGMAYLAYLGLASFWLSRTPGIFEAHQCSTQGQAFKPTQVRRRCFCNKRVLDVAM